jgi:hypothetical protein
LGRWGFAPPRRRKSWSQLARTIIDDTTTDITVITTTVEIIARVGSPAIPL